MVNGHDIDAVLAQRLEHRLDFVRQHGHIAGDGGVLIRADKRRPGVQPHSRVDRRAHFRELQIVAADRDLVDGAGLLSLSADNLRELRGIERRRRSTGGGSRGCRARGAFANQIERRLHLPREIRGRAVRMDVHIEHAGLVPEEMIVDGRDLDPVVKQRGHHRIHLVLRQHEIAHHDVHAGALRHGDPSAETKRRRSLDVRDRHADVVARDVDLQHVGLVIPLLAERREHLLVRGRNVLRKRGARAEHEQYCLRAD